VLRRPIDLSWLVPLELPDAASRSCHNSIARGQSRALAEFESHYRSRTSHLGENVCKHSIKKDYFGLPHRSRLPTWKTENVGFQFLSLRQELNI
jgi:hypothetical protein